MSKATAYADIHREMEEEGFRCHSRHEQKAFLVDWLDRALVAIEEDGGPMTPWEKSWLAGAIGDLQSGLHFKTLNALYNATLPANPGLDNHRAAEIESLTLAQLMKALQRLRQEPALEYPVFRWLER